RQFVLARQVRHAVRQPDPVRILGTCGSCGCQQAGTEQKQQRIADSHVSSLRILLYMSMWLDATLAKLKRRANSRCSFMTSSQCDASLPLSRSISRTASEVGLFSWGAK